MQFVGQLDCQIKDTQRVLDYNGRLFRFDDVDIPRLSGNGLIVIVTKPGLQYQGHRGNFDNLTMNQTDGASFINGVNVDELVLRMKEIKD